jgi:hypothetical protein
MIRYKVVTQERRSCGGRGLRRSMGRFERVYTPGKTVKAEPGSQGLYCFKTKQAANLFIEAMDAHSLRIIRVKPKSRGKRPKFAVGFDTGREIAIGYRAARTLGKGELKRIAMPPNYLRTSYPGNIWVESNLSVRYWDIPLETICYDKVEVID